MHRDLGTTGLPAAVFVAAVTEILDATAERPRAQVAGRDIGRVGDVAADKAGTIPAGVPAASIPGVRARVVGLTVMRVMIRAVLFRFRQRRRRGERDGSRGERNNKQLHWC